MPSVHPNAWYVVMIVTGFRIGAARRNVIDSPTVRPRRMRPRASGTLPHSHTGSNTPSSEIDTRRATALRGRCRSRKPSGSHTCTTIESRMPRKTNGRLSMTTLIESVKKSCIVFDSTSPMDSGASTRIATKSSTRAMPNEKPTAARVVGVPRGAAGRTGAGGRLMRSRLRGVRVTCRRLDGGTPEDTTPAC